MFHVKQDRPRRRRGASTVHFESTSPAEGSSLEQARRTNPQSYPQRYPPRYPPVYPPFPRLYETPHSGRRTRRVTALASSAPLKEAVEISRESPTQAIHPALLVQRGPTRCRLLAASPQAHPQWEPAGADRASLADIPPGTDCLPRGSAPSGSKDRVEIRPVPNANTAEDPKFQNPCPLRSMQADTPLIPRGWDPAWEPDSLRRDSEESPSEPPFTRERQRHASGAEPRNGAYPAAGLNGR